MWVMPEVEIVDDGCQLVGRSAVCTRERRTGESDRAVGIATRAGLERERGCLGMAIGPFALADRAFLPDHAQPLEIGEDCLFASRNGATGVGVVDPQHERPAVPVSVPAVGNGAERVAEVERPCRTRCEADADSHDLNLDDHGPRRRRTSDGRSWFLCGVQPPECAPLARLRDSPHRVGTQASIAI